MKTKTLIKISAALLTLFIGVALTIRFDAKIFSIDKISVTVNEDSENFCREQKLLCEHLVKEVNARIETETRKQIWQVKITELRAKLMQNTWFKNIAISRRLPDQINITAEIENPVALLSANSEIVGVAGNGEILTPVRISYLPSLPVLKGENFLHSLALRKTATTLLHDLEGNSELSEKNIAEITYSKEENFSLLILPSRSIVKINSEQATLKAARVAQVMEYLSSNQMNSRVIDARFSKKVLVRLRKGS